jgi:hypothetical protein
MNISYLNTYMLQFDDFNGYAAVFFIQVGVALLGAEPMHKEPRWRCWSARRAPSQVPVMS